MTTQYGNTPLGYVVKPRSVVKQEVQKAFTDALGQDLDLDDSTPQGNLINMLTDVLSQIDNQRQDDYNSRDVFKARGFQLDIIGKETNIPRRLGAPMQLTVLITAASGTTIPNMTQFILLNDSSKVYYNTEDILIGSTPAIVQLYLQDNVEQPAVAFGDKLQTSRYFPEITDITIQAFISAVPDEDDSLYAKRIVESGGISIDDLQNLENRLKAIPNVVDAYCSDNPTETTNTNGLPPHFIECVVLGGDLIDIANVMQDNIIAGTPTFNPGSGSGGNTVIINDFKGNPQTYNITRPTQIILNATLNYKVKGSEALSSQEQTDIQTMITNFINSTRIGATIYNSDLINDILNEYRAKISIQSLVLDIAGTTVNSSGSYTIPYRSYVSAGNISLVVS